MILIVSVTKYEYINKLKQQKVKSRLKITLFKNKIRYNT